MSVMLEGMLFLPDLVRWSRPITSCPTDLLASLSLSHWLAKVSLLALVVFPLIPPSNKLRQPGGEVAHKVPLFVTITAAPDPLKILADGDLLSIVPVDDDDDVLEGGGEDGGSSQVPCPGVDR